MSSSPAAAREISVAANHSRRRLVGAPVGVAQRLCIGPAELGVPLLDLTRNLVAFLRREGGKEMSDPLTWAVAALGRASSVFPTSVDRPIHRSK